MLGKPLLHRPPAGLGEEQRPDAATASGSRARPAAASPGRARSPTMLVADAARHGRHFSIAPDDFPRRLDAGARRKRGSRAHSASVAARGLRPVVHRQGGDEGRSCRLLRQRRGKWQAGPLFLRRLRRHRHRAEAGRHCGPARAAGRRGPVSGARRSAGWTTGSLALKAIRLQQREIVRKDVAVVHRHPFVAAIAEQFAAAGTRRRSGSCGGRNADCC